VLAARTRFAESIDLGDEKTPIEDVDPSNESDASIEASVCRCLGLPLMSEDLIKGSEIPDKRSILPLVGELEDSFQPFC